MGARWYVDRGSGIEGPVDGPALRAMADAGEVNPEDRAWCDGLAAWTTVGRVLGVFWVDHGRPGSGAAWAAYASGAVPLRGDDEDFGRPEAKKGKASAPGEAWTVDDLLALAWWRKFEVANLYFKLVLFAGFPICMIAFFLFGVIVLLGPTLDVLNGSLLAFLAAAAGSTLASGSATWRMARLLRFRPDQVAAIGLAFACTLGLLSGPILVHLAGDRLRRAGVRHTWTLDPTARRARRLAPGVAA